MATGLINEQHFYDIANAIRLKNGSTETYKPNEMADAIKELNCPFNLLEYGIGKELNDRLNQLFQNQIQENFNLFESKRTTANWNQIARHNPNIFYIPYETICTSCDAGFYCSGLKTLDNFKFENITGSCGNCFYGCRLNELPEIINFLKCTDLRYAFDNTTFDNVPENVTLNIGYKLNTNSTVSLYLFFRYAKKLNGTIKKLIINGDRVNSLQDFSWENLLEGCEEFIYTDSINVTTLQTIFFNNCHAPKKIKFGSLENCANFTNWINNTYDIETIEFDNWKKGNVVLFDGKGNNINGASTQYIIEQAMSPEYDDSGNVTNGVVARTLTLQSKAKSNFEALPNCEELRTLAITKLITIN